MCVVQAKAKLAEMGLEPSKGNIMKHIDPADINKLQSALRTNLNKKGNERAKEAYEASTDKRGALAQYLLDPNLATYKMDNSHSKETTSGSQTRKMWLTINQMASPMLYNSKEDAELIARDCKERDHESPSMAAAGKKQYEVEVTEEVYNNLTKDKVDLNSSGSVAPQDYKNIKDSMADPAEKKRKIVVKKEPTPEEIQKKTAEEQSRKVVAAFQGSLGTLRRTGERARKLANDTTDKAETLVTKGYPKEMAQHFHAQIKPMHDAAQKGLDAWSTYGKMDLAGKSEQEIEELRGQIDEYTGYVEKVIAASESMRKEVNRMIK